MTVGFFSRAILNICLTRLSVSPSTMVKPSTLSLPLRHQIRRRNGHERTIRLRSDSLRQVGFTRSRRSVKKNASPRLTLSLKELWMKGRENDSSHELVLGGRQSSHVIPLDIGLLRYNSLGQLLRQLRVITVVVRILWFLVSLRS